MLLTTVILFWLNILCDHKEEYSLKLDEELIGNITTKLIGDEFTCLRDLLSNSSDAFEKLAILEASADAFRKERDVNIIIRDVPEEGEEYDFIFSDCGIGMTKQDLINFIGSLGGSGTRKMNEKNETLVGKFGMGFYSTFVIAEKVKVISRKYNTNETHEMVFSKETTKYTIEKVSNSTLNTDHGTEIHLKIRQNYKSHIETDKIKKWIYKNFMMDPTRNYKIFISDKRPNKPETPKEKSEGQSEEEDEETDEEDGTEVFDDEEKRDEADKTDDVDIHDEAHKSDGEDKTEISDEKKKDGPELVQLFPWIVKSDYESVSEYYKGIEGHGSVLTWEKKRVNIRQKNAYGNQDSVGVEILLIIPSFMDMRIIGMESEGVHLLFVNQQAITLGEIPIFLKPMTFIIKSSEMHVTSTREKLLDHKNTFNEILQSVMKMAIPLLKAKLQENINQEMPTWEFYIKAGYTFAKNEKMLTLKNLFVPILPFSTQKGCVLLGDLISKDKDQEILYANIMPVVLPENVHHPLLDGIDQQVILLSGFLDEQIASNLEYNGKSIKNIADKKFDNLNRTGEEDLIDFCKKSLGTLVDEVVLSQRLKNAPFSIKEKHSQYSNAHKKMLGDYVIKKSLFRKTIESDIILEINPDSVEVQHIKELITQEETEKAQDALRISVMAASVLCNLSFTNTKNEFLGLVNVQRRILGMEQIEFKDDSPDMPIAHMPPNEKLETDQQAEIADKEEAQETNDEKMPASDPNENLREEL